METRKKTPTYQIRAMEQYKIRKTHQFYKIIVNEDGIEEKFYNNKNLENNIVNDKYDPLFHNKSRTASNKYYQKNKEKILEKRKLKKIQT